MLSADHRKEAEIVAQAGKLGAVTIATNMAGRGTDILLGGNPEFLTRQEMRAMGYDEALIEEASGHAETDDEALIEQGPVCPADGETPRDDRRRAR